MSVCARLKTPASRLLSSVAASASARVAFTRGGVAALRAASSAARVAAAPRATTAHPTEPLTAEEEEVLEADEAIDASEAPIPFSNIKSSIHPDTYTALTKDPFKYHNMSAVQAAVLDMLPDLAAPYNRNASRGDGDAKAAPVQHRDLLVKAKTGTGKTIAFLVPAIEARLNALAAASLKAEKDSGMKGDKRLIKKAEEAYARENVGTLIISPTRELAIQIANEALKLTKHHGHEVHLFVGGESKGRQVQFFQRGRRDIVVATPGRLRDVMDSVPGVLEALSNINTLVLDEADTLLDMGFRADIESIVSDLPATPKRQTFLFSATVSPAIRDIARKSLDKHHTFINCVKEDDSPVHAHIPQYVTVLPSGAHQIPHMLNLITQDQLQNPGKSKVMIFCNTAKMTALLSEMLRDLRATLPQPRTT
ncbi:hypothetical protein FRB90_008034, partial [Tulasnella sp. 427]